MTWKSFKIECRYFTIIDKMAKFQTIKTICMILTCYLKTEIYTKMLSQFSHEFFKQKYGNHGVPVKCFGD